MLNPVQEYFTRRAKEHIKEMLTTNIFGKQDVSDDFKKNIEKVVDKMTPKEVGEVMSATYGEEDE